MLNVFKGLTKDSKRADIVWAIMRHASEAGHQDGLTLSVGDVLGVDVAPVSVETFSAMILSCPDNAAFLDGLSNKDRGLVIHSGWKTYNDAAKKRVEEERRDGDAQLAQAEADRDGARPVDRLVCLREILNLWFQEEIDATIRFYAGHLPAVHRSADCAQAVSTLRSIYAAESLRSSDAPFGDRIRDTAKYTEAAAADVCRPIEARAVSQLRASFLILLAQDTDDRVSGAISMDHPMPVLK